MNSWHFSRLSGLAVLSLLAASVSLNETPVGVTNHRNYRLSFDTQW